MSGAGKRDRGGNEVQSKYRYYEQEEKQAGQASYRRYTYPTYPTYPSHMVATPRSVLLSVRCSVPVYRGTQEGSLDYSRAEGEMRFGDDRRQVEHGRPERSKH